MPTTAVQCLQPNKQWIWSPNQYCQSPSSRQGMDLVEEIFIRAYAVQSLFHTSELVPALSPDAGLYAAVFLQRFYMRRSIQDFPPRDMIPTAIFLGTKAADRPLRPDTIVDQFIAWEAWLQGKDEAAARVSKEAQQLTKRVLLLEDQLLRTIAFDFVYDGPYAYLADGLKKLFPRPVRTACKSFDQHISVTIRELAVALHDTCFASPVTLLFPSLTITAALIQYAAEATGISLQEQYDKARGVKPVLASRSRTQSEEGELDDIVSEPWQKVFQTHAEAVNYAVRILLDTALLTLDESVIPLEDTKIIRQRYLSADCATAIALDFDGEPTPKFKNVVERHFSKANDADSKTQDSKPATPVAPGHSPIVPSVASPVPRTQKTPHMSKTPGKRALEDASDDGPKPIPHRVAELTQSSKTTPTAQTPDLAQQQDARKIEISLQQDEASRNVRSKSSHQTP